MCLALESLLRLRWFYSPKKKKKKKKKGEGDEKIAWWNLSQSGDLLEIVLISDFGLVLVQLAMKENMFLAKKVIWYSLSTKE